MAERIKVDEQGNLTGGRRIKVAFVVETTWAYEAAEDLDEGETQYPVIDGEDDVISEIRQLVDSYLTQREAPFRNDYGPGAWGGWDGPFVLDVQVQRA